MLFVVVQESAHGVTVFDAFASENAAEQAAASLRGEGSGRVTVHPAELSLREPRSRALRR